MKLTYTFFQIFFLSTLLILIVTHAHSQSIEVQGMSTIECASKSYCLALQVKSGDQGTVFIGSSSIYFTYDTSALKYQSVQSVSFDESTDCLGNTPWDLQTYDSSYPGIFSMTMVLKNGEELNSCPEVTPASWVTIADVCFELIDSSVWPNIEFDPVLTHFNQNTVNDGSGAFTITRLQIQSATCLPDDDADGVPNGIDNCISVSNPFQEDADGDFIGDGCDTICNIPIESSLDLSICKGNSAVLSAFSIEGVAPYSYQWSNGATIGNIEVSPIVDTSYRVSITDANGCLGIDSVEVLVTQNFIDHLILYDIDLDMAYDTLFSGDTFYLSSLPPNYNLEALVSGDVESVGFVLTGTDFDTRTENGFPYRYDGNTNPVDFEAGTYNMAVSVHTENNLSGISCASQNYDFVIIDDCAKVDLGPDLVHCVGDSSVLEANVMTSHGPYDLYWSTGDSLVNSVTVSPTFDTEYQVFLMDETNCEEMDEIEVEITEATLIALHIWDLNADTIFTELVEGGVYVSSDLPTSWNIVAEVGGTTSRVDFYLGGDEDWVHVEYSAPYHFGGDNTNIDLPSGNYVMMAEPRESNSSTSLGCEPIYRSFQIIDSIGCHIVTTTLDSLPGSLNYALSCANSGETIYFSPSVHNDTIRLKNHIALIDKSITIASLPEQNVWIYGEGTSRVFSVGNGLDVTIRGLHVIAGTGSSGGAFDNLGTLNLNDVVVKKHPGLPGQSDLISNQNLLNVSGVLQIIDN